MSGNNRERGKGNSQDSNHSAPVVLQVYSKAISPGPDSRDGANQPRQPRRRCDQGTAEGGTRSAPNTDEGYPADGPTRRENRHQVWEILGPASQATRTGRAQPPPLPSTGAGGAWSHPLRLQFVRLSPMAKPPARSMEGAIGYDLYTPFSFILYPREIKLVYTDIAIKVPLGHYGRVAPKSGLTLKHHVTVLAGVLDPDYTGNVCVVLHNLSSDTKFTRQVGQPIGQLILEVASIFPTLEVGGLPITAQGPYGFGSQY